MKFDLTILFSSWAWFLYAASTFAFAYLRKQQPGDRVYRLMQLLTTWAVLQNLFDLLKRFDILLFPDRTGAGQELHNIVYQLLSAGRTLSLFFSFFVLFVLLRAFQRRSVSRKVRRFLTGGLALTFVAAIAAYGIRIAVPHDPSAELIAATLLGASNTMLIGLDFIFLGYWAYLVIFRKMRSLALKKQLINSIFLFSTLYLVIDVIVVYGSSPESKTSNYLIVAAVNLLIMATVNARVIYQNIRTVMPVLRDSSVDPIKTVTVGYQLSPREQEIVAYLAKGYINKEIAAQLSLSTNTVRNYIFTAYKKLGISHRAGLVKILSKAGEESQSR